MPYFFCEKMYVLKKYFKKNTRTLKSRYILVPFCLRMNRPLSSLVFRNLVSFYCFCSLVMFCSFHPRFLSLSLPHPPFPTLPSTKQHVVVKVAVENRCPPQFDEPSSTAVAVSDTDTDTAVPISIPIPIPMYRYRYRYRLPLSCILPIPIQRISILLSDIDYSVFVVLYSTYTVCYTL